MKKLIISLFFFPFLTSGQNGIDNLWLMGYANQDPSPNGGINIDFYSGFPVISNERKLMNFLDVSATISDHLGSRLFYTNGVWIANENNDTMVNGSGLSPGPYVDANGWNGLFIPQAALILSHPTDSMKYYLVHNTIDDGQGYAHEVYYSEIDMTMDSGRGAVISKNNILVNDTLMSGGITACKHGNGRDWWVVFHQALTNAYYTYLLDLSGFHFHSKQNLGVVRSLQNKGQLCFSPDGSKFAYHNGRQGQDLDILDFDRCTGTFNNPIHVDINIGKDSIRCGGVAFSPNSKVLYVSSGFVVYQFDLTATDIPASQTTVAVWDTFYSPQPPLATTFYLSQLAPDGKIYISSPNGVLSMHVIDYPDSVGLSCHVCQHCVSLSRYNGGTMPNHPNYRLGALKGSACDSLPDAIDETAHKVELKVFPNPVVNGEITFTYSSTSDVKVLEVYNVDGKIVARYNLPQWSSVQRLRLPKLAEGVYLARMVGMNMEASVKFMVE